MKLARDLDLPIDAVTQTFAIMGKRGSGKTYTATKLVELMVGERAQVVIVDPIGNWWGLRAPSRGTALAIPVLGGDHGDIPLTPRGGEAVAQFIVECGSSAVIDVSEFRKGERTSFVTALAEEIYRLKRAKKTAMHLVLEEAHVFIPQTSYAGADALMVGAWEDLVRLGRNRGIGVTMISQRPQSVAKAVLNQAEVLICHQLVGSHERKAVKDWVVSQVGETTSLLQQLPSLEVGEAIVWSPSWLDVLQRTRILKKDTLDTSKTPEVGKSIEATSVKKLDLDALTAAMAEAVEEAKANDPKELKKRIADLERQLAELTDSAPDASAIDAAVRDAIEDRDREWAGAWQDAIAQISDRVRQVLECSAEQLAVEASGQLEQIEPLRVPEPRERPRERPMGPKPAPPRRGSGGDVVRSDGAAGLSVPLRRILDALAWWSVLGIDEPTTAQVGFKSGYAPKGGTFQTYLSRLASAGFIVRQGGNIRLTADGDGAAAWPETPGTRDELHEAILDVVGAEPLRKILRVVIDRGEIATDDLGEETGYSPTGGTFSTYLSRLSSLGLIERGRGVVRPSEVLELGYTEEATA